MLRRTVGSKTKINYCRVSWVDSSLHLYREELRSEEMKKMSTEIFSNDSDEESIDQVQEMVGEENQYLVSTSRLIWVAAASVAVVVVWASISNCFWHIAPPPQKKKCKCKGKCLGIWYNAAYKNRVEQQRFISRKWQLIGMS